MLSRGHKLALGKKFVVREKDILASCKHILNLHQNWGRLHWRRINNGPKLIRGKWVKNPEMAGLSDTMIWILHGPMLCVELKAEDGVMSEEQIEFGKALTRVGHTYRVVRSPEELERLLAQHGVPPSGLLV